MLVLALKLTLPPALIGAASLAGRRWGPGFSGWMVALPLVSGPIAFFLALDHGTSFAAAAARGALTGAAGQAAFCVGYGWSGRGGPWPVALAGGTLAFAMGAAALGPASRLPVGLLVPVVAALVALALLVMPLARPREVRSALGRWDIPCRMITGTVAVLALTRAAPALGPRLSGVLSAYPVVTAVLAVFAQRTHGAPDATAVLRGLLRGMFSFVAFYAALALTVERVGIAGGFAVAVAAALGAQAVSGGAIAARARSGRA